MNKVVPVVHGYWLLHPDAQQEIDDRLQWEMEKAAVAADLSKSVLSKSYTGFSDLMKAMKDSVKPGAKYLWRERNAFPPPNWRYHYTVGRKGKLIGDEDDLKEGHSFQVKIDGKSAHATIKQVHGKRKIVIEHDGKTLEMSMKKFTKLVRDHHKDGIKEHQENQKAILRRVMRYGTEGQIAYRARVAAEYGVTVTPGFDMSYGQEKWESMTNKALTLHADALPGIESDVPDHITEFANPKGPMKALLRHQLTGVARALDSFKKRDGFLLMDEAGLGKTATAMATALAHGGKKVLIVHQARGKEGSRKQWRDTAKLFGRKLIDHDKAREGKGGLYIASYDEIGETDPSKKVYNAKTGKEVDATKLKGHLASGDWDLVIFDEAHSMSSPKSTYAQAGVELQDHCDKAMYVSATPFSKISHMHYMRKMGLFENGEDFIGWAEAAGAKVTTRRGEGDLPVQLENPKTPMPMAHVAALLHTSGMGLKRMPILDGLSTGFEMMSHKDVQDHHHEAFEKGEQISALAKAAGLDEFMTAGVHTIWRKQMWEVSKAHRAVEVARREIARVKEENPNAEPQVLFFTQYKAHDHNPLKAIGRMIRSRADTGELHPDAHKYADHIDKLISEMPVENPMDVIMAQFGGAEKFSQMHGTGSALQAQQDYQSGKKKFAIASMAKGGTGLSFHDTKGGRNRIQINLSLPWSAEEFTQVSGRSHRLGSVSDTSMHWICGTDKSESRFARIVGDKLRSMGSLVAGDPVHHISTGERANWEYGQSTDHADYVKAVLEESKNNPLIGTETDSIKETRDTLRDSIDKYLAGGNPLKEFGDKLRGERARKETLPYRKAIAQMHAVHGVKFKMDGDRLKMHSDAFKKQPGFQAGWVKDSKLGIMDVPAKHRPYLAIQRDKGRGFITEKQNGKKTGWYMLKVPKKGKALARVTELAEKMGAHEHPVGSTIPKSLSSQHIRDFYERPTARKRRAS